MSQLEEIMGFEPDVYRESSRATWEDLARNWEERREWFARIAGRANDRLVELAEPRPGDTVLDIAAGPGDLGFAAAAQAGPSGRLISTDFAAEMVEVARRGGAAAGVANAEHRIMDAERMDLADDSVDVALCRWGYMLMADPARALSETRRVLRDGGRLAFAVWSTPDRNPWIVLPVMTLVERGHFTPPGPGEPGILALGDPDRVRELVTGAGFSDPLIEELTFIFEYPDFDDLWDTLVRISGPITRVIGALPDDEREATRAAIEERLAGNRREDGSYAAAASTWCVRAE